MYGFSIESRWLVWPGEVEEEVLVLDEVREAVLVADVRDVHAHAVLDPRDVVEVAAVLGDQRVDQSVTSLPPSTSSRASVEPMKPRPPVIEDALAAEGVRQVGRDHETSFTGQTLPRCREAFRTGPVE